MGPGLVYADLNQPESLEPSFFVDSWVPVVKPCIEFIGPLQQRWFCLVKVPGRMSQLDQGAAARERRLWNRPGPVRPSHPLLSFISLFWSGLMSVLLLYNHIWGLPKIPDQIKEAKLRYSL